MKKILFFLLTAALGVSADEHMHSSAVDAGLIFHCDFDGTIKAKKSLGEAQGSASGDVGAFFAPGILNQGLRVGVSADEKVRYMVSFPAAKNIRTDRGSVSFWIRPEHDAGKNPHFTMWFAARGRKSDLFVYKYQSPDLYFFMDSAGKNALARTSVAEWRPGQWHHVVATWDGQTQSLYVDGALCQRSLRRDAGAAPYLNIFLGSLGWAVEKGTAIIDELKIFDRPLELGEVIRESGRFAHAGERRTAPMHITVGRAVPRLDGRIARGEYAMSGTGFMNPGGRYAHKQGRYHLAHDEKYLYIALEVPFHEPKNQARTKRDSDVWMDDSIEVWLAGKTHVDQIIFNAAGGLYDCRIATGRDEKWNLSDYRLKSAVADGIWTSELAVPLKDLGDTLPEKINIGCSFRSGNRPEFIAIAPVRKEFGFGDTLNFAALSFKKDAPRYAVESIGRLNAGELDLTIRGASSGVVTFSAGGTVWIKENITKDSFRLKRNGSVNGTLSLDLPGLFHTELRAQDSTPVAVEYIYTDIPTQTLHTVLRNAGGNDGGAMRLTLKSKTDGRAHSMNTPVRRDQVFWTAGWNVKELPVGDYDFEAVYIDADGKANGDTFSQYFRKPQATAPWDDNKIGQVPGEVPPPWVPVIATDDGVKTLTQHYRLGESLLPSEFKANGHELLSRPCVIRVNGRVVQGRKQPERLGATPCEATFRNSGSADGVGVGALVMAQFDGMLWHELTFGGKDQTIHSLTVDIPLKKEFAEQVHSCDGDTHRATFGATGPLPAGIWHKNLYRKPAFWVGNDRAGLAWYAEDLRGWSNRDKDRTVEIIPGKDETVVRLNIIDRPVKLASNRLIRFGLHGTPVKKPSQEIRPNRINKEWRWVMKGSYYFNYLDSGKEFFDRKGYEPYLNIRKNKQANRLFLYVASNGCSPYAPEWGWYGKLWTSRPIGDYIIEYNIKNREERNRYVWTYSCLNSKSFREFYLWKLAGILRDGDWDVRDLYYDLVGPRLCDNTEHGCGWKDDDGIAHPTYTIAGSRDFHRRIYQHMKKLRPESLHLYHVTGQPVVPAVHSFCDAVVEGETFFGNELFEKETYFGILTPELFRTAYYGQKWGYPTMFIPQLARSAMFHRRDRVALWTAPRPPEEMIRAYRHFIGYACVHDVSLWTECVTDTRLLEEYWDAKTKFFGAWDNQVRFIPYWTKDKPFAVNTARPDRVLVSAYVRGDKVMLAALNDTDVAQKVSVRYPGMTSLTPMSGETQRMNRNTFDATLPPRGFMLYFLQ